jgi:hypothetical protein
VNDQKKSKDQLIKELTRLREKIRKRDNEARELTDKLGDPLFADELQRIALDASRILIIFDNNGIIQFVNEHHIKSFSKDKLSRDQIIGKDIRNLHKSVHIGIIKEYEKILKGETIKLKNIYCPEFPSDHSGSANYIGIPLMKGGRVLGGVLIRQDVTEGSHLQSSLLQSIRL